MFCWNQDINKDILNSKHAAKIDEKWIILNDKVISSSAMGFIKVGYSLITKDKVCIKEMNYTWLQSGSCRDWFTTWRDFKYNAVQEAKLMSVASGHPNVVEYYDYVVDDVEKKVYIIMEYIEGSMTLEKYFCKVLQDTVLHMDDWRLKEKVAVEVLRQLLSAVGYLHAHFIVHRDLRLENILIVQNTEEPLVNVEVGRKESTNTISSLKLKTIYPNSKNWKCPQIKLFDFGLATIFFDRERDKFLTGGPGSEYYISPEAFSKKKHVGYSVDIWAIGVIAHLLGTGYHPFGEKDKKLKSGWEVALFQPLQAFRHFCNRAMHPNPEKRATVFELVDHPFLNSISFSPYEPPSTNSYLPKPYAPPRLISPRPWESLIVDRHVFVLYKPIDLHIPASRFHPLTHWKNIDPWFVDDIKQGYWGWWTSYKAEEIDTLYIESTLVSELVMNPLARESYILDKTVELGPSDTESLRQIIGDAPNPNSFKMQSPVSSLYLFLKDFSSGELWKVKGECKTANQRIKSMLYDYWKVKRNSVPDGIFLPTCDPESDASRRTSEATLAQSTASERTLESSKSGPLKHQPLPKFYRRISNFFPKFQNPREILLN